MFKWILNFIGPENSNGPPIKSHINPLLTIMTLSPGSRDYFFIPYGTYYPEGRLISPLPDPLCHEVLLNFKTNRKWIELIKRHLNS